MCEHCLSRNIFAIRQNLRFGRVKLLAELLHLLVVNKRGESFGQDFFGGEEMTFMRYAVL